MSSSEVPIHLDDVLANFKLFGRYHLISLTLMFLANATNSIYSDNYVFAAPVVEYRCKDERFSNHTCGSLQDTGEMCTEWLYADPNSLVAEFQLACQDWKRTLIGSIHMFGYMVGLLIVGPLSDRIGRKKLIVLTGVLGAVFGLSRSFASSYWLYIAFEFLESSIGDSSSPVFMMTIEMVTNKKRVKAHTFGCTGFILGSIILALTASQIAHFRTLLQALYIPAFLFFFYLFLVDESPRWLLSKGRKNEAIAIIEKAAKKNNLDIDNQVLNNIVYEKEEGIKFVKLLQETISSRTLLRRFFICCVWWIVSTFLSYGLSTNVVFLQGNKYLNFGVMALMSIPGYLAVVLSLQRYTRKTVLCVSFLLSAVIMTVQAFIPANLPWLSVLLFFLGKMLNCVYFEVTYIFTSEIFPTYTRNSMHALCSSIGRFGCILAPQTPLLIKYWNGLPSLVFGLATLVAGLVTLWAPDGADVSLPDNVQQAEAIGKTVATKDVQLNTIT